MVVPFVYTEEEYKELENELEYVRIIKDSAEKTLKEVREENRKLKEVINDLKTVIQELAKKHYGKPFKSINIEDRTYTLD